MNVQDRKLQMKLNRAIKNGINKGLFESDYDYSAGRGSLASVEPMEHRYPKDSEFISNPDAFNNAVIDHITDAVETLKSYVYPKFGNNPSAKDIITRCMTALMGIKKIFPLSEGLFDFMKNRKKKKEQKATLESVITNLKWILNTPLKNQKVISRLGQSKVDMAIEYIQKVIELCGGEVSLEDTYSLTDALKKVKEYLQQEDYDGAISFIKQLKKTNGK